MKQLITNTLATSSLTTLILAIIALLSGGNYLCISSIFQIAMANFIIHLGFIFLQRFDFSYFILESILQISYAFLILILFGSIFHWFSSTPIYILFLMLIVVYILSIYIQLFKTRKEIDEINHLLAQKNIDIR